MTTVTVPERLRPLTAADKPPYYPPAHVAIENVIRRLLRLPELRWVDGVPLLVVDAKAGVA